MKQNDKSYLYFSVYIEIDHIVIRMYKNFNIAGTYH